jgi:HSP20 family molecular chaperone IbpA
MWSEALATLEDAERRHKQCLALIDGDAAPAWEPPADVYETEQGLLILVALPGVSIEDVSLYVDPKGVVVQTRRVPVAARPCQRILRMEIPYGIYERRIDLPRGQYTLQSQKMVAGCLELELTRARTG